MGFVPIFNQCDLIILQEIKRSKDITLAQIFRNNANVAGLIAFSEALDRLVSKGIVKKTKSGRENILSYIYKSINIDEMIEVLK